MTIPEAPLAMCLRHIAEGEARIASQLELVASLVEAASNEDTLATARALLANLEASVATTREHLKILQAKLAG